MRNNDERRIKGNLNYVRKGVTGHIELKNKEVVQNYRQKKSLQNKINTLENLIHDLQKRVDALEKERS